MNISPPKAAQKRYYCAFCGKSDREVRLMVAGAMDACICNECISVCVEVVAFNDDPGRIEYESWFTATPACAPPQTEPPAA